MSEILKFENADAVTLNNDIATDKKKARKLKRGASGHKHAARASTRRATQSIKHRMRVAESEQQRA